MPSSTRALIERLLFGIDRPDPRRKLSTIETTSRTDSTASSPDLEKAPTPPDQKGFTNTIKAQSSSDQPNTQRRPSAAPSLPTVLRSPTLYSLTSNLQQRWIRPRSENGTDATAWEPSFRQIRPLSGICALFVTLCCVFGSLVILKVSDGQPTHSWPVQPTVYLAIVAAIANSALRMARTQAAPISWWYHASRGGTVRSLERHWETTNSLVQAIFHSRHISFLNITIIAVSFAIIDGPLLQRASYVEPGTQSIDMNVDLVLPPELPNGFSGYALHDITFSSQDSNQVLHDFVNDAPLRWDVPKCDGACRFTVQAPGLGLRNCSHITWPITLEMTRNISAKWGRWNEVKYGANGTAIYRNNPCFYTTLEPAPPIADWGDIIGIRTGLPTWPSADAPGEFVERTCIYGPAIAEYDVQIEDGMVSFPDWPNQGRFLRFANNTWTWRWADLNHPQELTLANIASTLGIVVNSNASVILRRTFGPSGGYEPDLYSYNAVPLRHSIGVLNHVAFTDPLPSILWKFNQVMFRGAVKAALWPNVTKLIDPGVSIHQRVLTKQTKTQNVFRSDFRWYAGAAVFEIVTILLVLPMFWSYWTLGRNMTLSPFNLALAFDAPLVKDVHSAAGAKGVVRKHGDMELKFGMVSSSNDGSAMNQSGTYATGRLGIAQREDVGTPRKGMRFSE